MKELIEQLIKVVTRLTNLLEDITTSMQLDTDPDYIVEIKEKKQKTKKIEADKKVRKD